MSEKVLGFKKGDIQAVTLNNEKVWAVFEKDLVPVVSLEWLLKEIMKEWAAHRNNWDENGEWFECEASETGAYCNYAVGAQITTHFDDGREKTIILKNKKEADAYSKKEKERYGSCSVCNRFKRLLAAARKEAGR